MKMAWRILIAFALFFSTSVTSGLQPETFYAFDEGASTGGGLTQGPDGSLYGTGGGGHHNLGTVFRVSTNGIVSVLLSFNGTNGANPQGGLLLARDGTFYGTTSQGGTTDNGTVFRITPDGALTTLVSFAQTNGAYPTCALVWGLEGVLYGTTRYGGETGNGTVFRVTTNGSLATVVSFNDTNGARPYAGLALARDGDFYGTTAAGGNGGRGTVFKVTSGGKLNTLFSFLLCEPNGAFPMAGLVEGSDGNLYGTTGGNGCASGSPDGTIFRMTTNGVLTTLASFSLPSAAFPKATMVLATDGNLYGTTILGGANDSGTVFKITTNGALTMLAASFDVSGRIGYAPTALVFAEDGNLYGIAAGGNGGYGTVFKLTLDGLLGIFATLSAEHGTSPLGCVAEAGGGWFYGTTSTGGSENLGTVFQVTTNGALNSSFSFTGTNGAKPQAAMTLGPDGNLYGTTSHGGSTYVFPYGPGYGTVFQLTTTGALRTLASFSGLSDGKIPLGGLVLGKDGAFYGTTSEGGSNFTGTVFKITTNGLLSTLGSFLWDSTNNAANSAQRPYGRLVQGADDSFYGTTYYGGSRFAGTVFKITTNGLVTILSNFNRENGANPAAGLIMAEDGIFYGTASAGGGNNLGTIFKVTTNGLLTLLFSFNGRNGANPLASLLVGRDGNLYGTTSAGGDYDLGTVFKITTNGILTVLFSFNGANGATPSSELMLSSYGTLYGTTSSGGPAGRGTIFRLSMSSFSSITKQMTGSMLLKGIGPANAPYRLWATTNLCLPFTSWTLSASNVIDPAGDFSYLDAGAATNRARFYRISVP